MNFASDNVGPAAPEIMAAMSEANAARSAPYGADPWTERAEALIREVFEAPEAEVEALVALVRDRMENAYPLEVPLVVDVGHGASWAAAH